MPEKTDTRAPGIKIRFTEQDRADIAEIQEFHGVTELSVAVRIGLKAAVREIRKSADREIPKKSRKPT